MVDDVHALAAPLRVRIALGSASEYIGVISIARHGQPFDDGERDLFAYLAAQTAVSVENAFVHENTRREALTDELTGLANVRRFGDALSRELERTRRFSGQFSLVMLDIDDFKRVNDEFGHQQGDVVLVEVARELRDQCREIDHRGALRRRGDAADPYRDGPRGRRPSRGAGAPRDRPAADRPPRRSPGGRSAASTATVLLP